MDNKEKEIIKKSKKKKKNGDKESELTGDRKRASLLDSELARVTIEVEGLKSQLSEARGDNERLKSELEILQNSREADIARATEEIKKLLEEERKKEKIVFSESPKPKKNNDSESVKKLQEEIKILKGELETVKNAKNKAEEELSVWTETFEDQTPEEVEESVEERREFRIKSINSKNDLEVYNVRIKVMEKELIRKEDRIRLLESKIESNTVKSHYI